MTKKFLFRTTKCELGFPSLKEVTVLIPWYLVSDTVCSAEDFFEGVDALREMHPNFPKYRGNLKTIIRLSNPKSHEKLIICECKQLEFQNSKKYIASFDAMRCKRCDRSITMSFIENYPKTGMLSDEDFEYLHIYTESYTVMTLLSLFSKSKSLLAFNQEDMNVPWKDFKKQAHQARITYAKAWATFEYIYEKTAGFCLNCCRQLVCPQDDIVIIDSKMTEKLHNIENFYSINTQK